MPVQEKPNSHPFSARCEPVPPPPLEQRNPVVAARDAVHPQMRATSSNIASRLGFFQQCYGWGIGRIKSGKGGTSKKSISSSAIKAIGPIGST